MFRVAVAQMNSQSSVKENLAMAQTYGAEAADQGAQLVSFPENFLMLREGRENILSGAESIHGPSVAALREMAQKHRIWIHGGSLLLREPGENLATNSTLLLDDQGQIVARYDKIHLFDVNLSDDRFYGESQTIRPGTKPVVVQTPWGPFGLTICYDLRFPLLYERLSQEGAKVIFIPAAFTAHTGQAHWDVLTRARAIENQCFVVAAAQWGDHGGKRKTHGQSRIIDPWGTVLVERDVGVGVVTAELDFEVLEKTRRELPALRHRRPL